AVVRGPALGGGGEDAHARLDVRTVRAVELTGVDIAVLGQVGLVGVVVRALGSRGLVVQGRRGAPARPRQIALVQRDRAGTRLDGRLDRLLRRPGEGCGDRDERGRGDEERPSHPDGGAATRRSSPATGGSPPPTVSWFSAWRIRCSSCLRSCSVSPASTRST